MLVVVATALAAWAWLASTRQPLTGLVILAAFGGAAAAGILVPRRPVAAFGVLFALASLTRFTVDLPIGGMRLEQPATAAVIASMVIFRSRLSLPSLRPILPIGIAAAVYLAALTVSSLVEAPDRGLSLRIVAWTAISMASGVAAYLLTARAIERPSRWIIAAGLVTAIVGIATAVVFYVAGPDIAAIDGSRSTVPRVKIWGWEVNLYAIYLAAIVPLALEEFRRRVGRERAAIVALLIVAMALGITRGAWLGLIIGVAAYGLVLLWRRAPSLDFGRIVAVAVPAGLVGLVLAAVLLDPKIQLARIVAAVPPRPTAVPGASPTPSPAPLPTLRPGSGASDSTVAFRFDHIQPAIDDWKKSPLIGLGAESFGQRHIDDTQPGSVPDHIAIMGLAVLYDSGLIGLAGIIVLVLLTGVALWRGSRRPGAAGTAGAYLGSLTVLLVAYQATNALHFAMNWLILGVALGVAFGGRPDRSTEAG